MNENIRIIVSTQRRTDGGGSRKVKMHRRKMERMEIGAWRLALGGVKMLDRRTSDRASSLGGFRV